MAWFIDEVIEVAVVLVFSVNLHLFISTCSCKNGSNLFLGQLAEILSTSEHADGNIVLCEFRLSRTRAHSFHSMIDKSVAIKASERLIMLL